MIMRMNFVARIMTIVELSVEGYRSLRDITIKLKPLNVIVGSNGCGKSNLYRAMYLLAQAAAGNLAREIASEGGMPSVLWAGQRRKNEDARINLTIKFDDVQYQLVCGRIPISERPQELAVFGNDPHIKEEHLKVFARGKMTTVLSRKGNAINAVNIDGRKFQFPMTLTDSESVLSGLRDPQKFPEVFALREELLSWRFYHKFRTDLESPLRRPQTPVLTPVMSHDGRDVSSAIATIYGIGDADGLREAIKEAFPHSSVLIESPDDLISISHQMPAFERPFELTEMSDGTLQYLCLAAALLSPRPPSFIAINEPERSLHVSLLAPLARMIVRASKQSQLWITTHSQELARAIQKYSDVQPIALEKLEGETRLLGVGGTKRGAKRRIQFEADDD